MGDESLIISVAPELMDVELDGAIFKVFVKKNQCAGPRNLQEATVQLTQHDLLLHHLLRDYDALRKRVALLEEGLAKVAPADLSAEAFGPCNHSPPKPR